MNRLLKSCAFAALALTGATHLAAQDPEPQLVKELRSIVQSQGWSGDRWSVMVVSLDAGDTLFAFGGDSTVVPASNMKLFTTAAALRYLGPDYVYSTYLTGTGPIRDGVLEGDLLVYGTGDPTLSDRFFESKTAVWEALADSLSALGVRRIAGDVIGDASYFEDGGYGRGWQDTYNTHTYAAPASALSFNDNVATLVVRPSEPGSPPTIQVIPGGEVEVGNQARTVSSGRSVIRIERESYGSPGVLTGQIRTGQSPIWRALPVSNPARYTASVVAEVLQKKGIAVGGRVGEILDPAASPVTGRRVFAPAFEDRAPVQVLAVHHSPELREILKVVNQLSHNLYAESVLRTVGRVATGHGSAEGGARAMTALLEEAGVEPGTVQVDDGSGLSRLDRVTAGSVVKLLAYMAESPHWEEYNESLPEAATSRGLRRMQKTAAAGNLRAKTGTIDRVSALSGYVTTESGERLAFSIISNNVPSTWKAKRLEDRIGARLAAVDRPVPVMGSGRVAASRPAARTDSALAAARDTAMTATGEARRAAADPEPAAEIAAAEESGRSYVIKRGDTLDGIARKNGVSVGALQEANPGLRPRRLLPGQEITIPGG